MRSVWSTPSSPALALGLTTLVALLACNDEGNAESSNATETTTGDGDGEPTETGGDGDGDPTETGDGDGDGDGEPPPAPELYCPGGPSSECDLVEGAPLEAGVAVLSIVPDCYESWTDVAGNGDFDDGEDDFADCGCDRLCPGEMGYPGPDEGEGDGVFQAIYLAGFQSNRPMSGVRGVEQGIAGEGDGLWARAVALQQGNTRIVLVSIDTVGYFRDEIVAVRELLVDQDIDLLIVSSTHTHEGPDTMGLWGPSLSQSGFNPDYRAQLRMTIAEAATAAVADLREVGTMTVGRGDASTTSAEKGILNVSNDLRDPFIVDEALDVMLLSDTQGQPIVSLVNFASHPESMADEITLATSDYVHALRRTMETGSQWVNAPGKPGLGAPCVFFSGALGGMMSPLRVQVTNPDGDTYGGGYSWEKTDSIGQLLGELALDTLAAGEVISDPQLQFGAQPLLIEVINDAFKLAFANGLFDREVVEMDNKEYVRSEFDIVELGPVRMLTAPGEVFPELAVGGYDGSQMFTELADFIDPMNPNPPQVDTAPPGPYLKERMGSPYTWVLGLGNDQLGYIIPEYDFVLSDTLPYLNEAEGDHYEETNSIGPHIAGIVDEQADFLTAFIDWL